ncbi:MAG TPA: hypothetical protein VGE76_08210 [Opitutaceae bacterium]
MLTAFTAQPPVLVDPLFDLELKIARRADELSAGQPAAPKGLNLNCWLHAELEICRALQLIPERASGGAQASGPFSPRSAAVFG